MDEIHHPSMLSLIEYLKRVPAIETNDTPYQGFGSGFSKDGWWIKFSIDVEHTLAWQVVQEFAFVLNYLSLNERLPTVFKPVSPPPYLNGGPKESLSWVIECDSSEFRPGTAAKWLEGRLPRPVEDIAQWSMSED